MKNIVIAFLLILSFSCKQDPSNKNEIVTSDIDEVKEKTVDYTDLTIVFASCNDQDMAQPLWKPIIECKPNVFIWGGDNIYADTDDMKKMKADYNKIKTNPDYVELTKRTLITGTWDDHDYGDNDAGSEWPVKAEAQDLFFDFIGVAKQNYRRNKEGVYHIQSYNTQNGSIKVVLLDTRYFRDSLKFNPEKGRRYMPWPKGEGGTILGDTQWKWLTKELEDDKPIFTLIVTSIQFLADENGWEKWGNFPDEVEKMYQILRDAKSKNIIMLSGDRHLAEFSVSEVEGLDYPLVDFTTSGMTKTYPDSPFEPNRFRIGDQVKQLNFGLLKFDFKKEKVTMEIRGEDNHVFDVLVQEY